MDDPERLEAIGIRTLLDKATDRIEQLEAALRKIDNEATGRIETWRIIKGIARRALDGEEQ